MMYLVVVALLPMALSIQPAPLSTMLDVTDAQSSLEMMESAFSRSTETQRQSMDTISKTMTQTKALEVLQKSTLVKTPTLSQITTLLSGKQHLRKGAHDGFGGLNGARLLLNDMIHEVLVKYDAEIAKCTDYYAKQCALMEVARGQIASANYIAATARALILDAQYNINFCEIAIPETKAELKDHNL